MDVYETSGENANQTIKLVSEPEAEGLLVKRTLQSKKNTRAWIVTAVASRGDYLRLKMVQDIPSYSITLTISVWSGGGGLEVLPGIIQI